MKKLLLSIVLTQAVILPTLAAHAQGTPTRPSAPKPAYNNFWRPLTESEVKTTIARNPHNGVVLEPLMMRAILQQKTRWFLKAIKAASDADPKNATLRATYGWALAKSHFNFTIQGSTPPDDLSKSYPLDTQSIWNILQSARDIDPKCWEAYMGEASLPLGASVGKPTKSAALTKQAFQIKSNAVTLTNYGWELVWQGTLMRDVKQKRAGLRLLELARKRYPNYYKTDLNLYSAYRKKDVADKAKSEAAKQRFLATIPPESRSLPWVKNYLKFIGLI